MATHQVRHLLQPLILLFLVYNITLQTIQIIRFKNKTHVNEELNTNKHKKKVNIKKYNAQR